MTRITSTNWAGSIRYGFHDCLVPASLDALRQAVASASTLKVVGSGHSFNEISDGTIAIVLSDMPLNPVVEPGGTQVSIGAHATYGALALFLAEHGLAVHNLASLPHISIAGAIATATHGSGAANGNLATAVAGLEVVTADGNVLRVKRGDPDFDGMVVHLGVLGVITRVTLDVQPAFDVVQSVYEGLGWSDLLGSLDKIMEVGYSVSVFTQWGEEAGSIWIKDRDTDVNGNLLEGMSGVKPAVLKRNPIIGMDPVNATDQFGVSGLWSDRLPHFKMGFTPSNGEEIQSEFHVPRKHGRAAIEALLSIRETFKPLIQVTELRTVAADSLWMSPQSGRDTLSLHFTWVRDQAAVERAVAAMEEALAPYDALPHWGKVFCARDVGKHYPRFADFKLLRERLDPGGKFLNSWAKTALGIG